MIKKVKIEGLQFKIAMVDTPELTSTHRHTKSIAIYETFPLKETQKLAEKLLYIKQMGKNLNREKTLKHNKFQLSTAARNRERTHSSQHQSEE